MRLRSGTVINQTIPNAHSAVVSSQTSGAEPGEDYSPARKRPRVSEHTVMDLDQRRVTTQRPRLTSLNTVNPLTTLTTFAKRAKAWVSENPQSMQALQQTLNDCFHPGSGRINRSLFPKHPWLQGRQRINSTTERLMSQLSQKLPAEVDRLHNEAGLSELKPAEIIQRYEAAIKAAVESSLEAFREASRSTRPEPLSLFIFDTETDRLFGGVVSLGWIKLDIDDGRVQVACNNHFLNPAFVSYGAERIHHLSVDALRELHAKGQTTPAVDVAHQWLQNLLASRSAIGFNVLYDLNAMKRLFLTLDLEADKVNQLFELIGEKFTLDAQDYLLRIDPLTRHEHQLPFSETKRHREFAETFDHQFPDGSEINYLPNRKLVSYGEGFLGMNTENAHDALYDCVMTLGGFCQSMALRSEVLEHESTLPVKDRRLSNYDRTIHPGSALRRRINAPARVKSEDRPIYLSATHNPLPTNPALKTTPFIYQPTGMTVHRRHIIPKSTLASVLLSQPLNSADHRALLYDTLNHPLFETAAPERLSTVALSICQAAKALQQRDTPEIRHELSALIGSFVDDIEKANQQGLSIRYYERQPAKSLLEALPSRHEVMDEYDFADEQNQQIDSVLAFILYAFYHSLEFNQFIGPGGENVIAGKAFHFLAAHEAEVIDAIDAATDRAAVNVAVGDWLTAFDRAISLDLSHPSDDDSIEQGLSQLASQPFERFPVPTKVISSELVLYFLEQQSAAYQMMDPFLERRIPTSLSTESVASARQLKDQLMEKGALLNLIIEHSETATRKTFSDRVWLNPVMEQIDQMQGQSLEEGSDVELNAALDDQLLAFYNAVTIMLDQMNQSSLYEGDKALIQQWIMRLFGDEMACRVELPASYEGDLSIEKKAARELVKSVYDSTAYDLPISAAAALQNHLLIPLFADVVGKEPLSLDDAKRFLSGVLTADQQIAECLAVSRQVDVEKPLYAPYRSYLS